MDEVHITKIKVHGEGHRLKLFKAVSAAIREGRISEDDVAWPGDDSEDFGFVVLYGEPAKRFAVEAHRQGLPLHGYTEEVWI